MSARPRILIVDDSAFMRSRIVRDVTAAGMEVVAEGRSGEEGAELYRRFRPDVVTMDLTMRGQDGLAATAAIIEADPRARIVLFSIVNDPEIIERARATGVSRYVHKSRPAELVTALRELAGGAE